MKTIKAVMVEDETPSADVLRTLINECCPEIEIAGVAPTVKKAVEMISDFKPDLVFLDVELPDGNGFSVIESFPEGRFNVIFVTAFEHYALKAIKACAIDYLLKPVDGDDLVAAVRKLPADIAGDKRQLALMYNAKQKNGLKRRLALPTQEGLKFIEQMEIVWCEAQGSYTNFLLLNKEKILVSKPLNYFEEILDEEQFCRCHQSYMVNLAHIKSYVKGRGGYLIMNDGSKVEVSARMKHNLLDRFAK
jgi:two-component system LytT family response regulator